MTKKQLKQRFIDFSKLPENRTIFDVYDKPSFNKVLIYNGCVNLEHDLLGMRGKVVTHNAHYFTFGFITTTVEPDCEVKTIFHFITYANHYTVDVTDIYFNY